MKMDKKLWEAWNLWKCKKKHKMHEIYKNAWTNIQMHEKHKHATKNTKWTKMQENAKTKNGTKVGQAWLNMKNITLTTQRHRHIFSGKKNKNTTNTKQSTRNKNKLCMPTQQTKKAPTVVAGLQGLSTDLRILVGFKRSGRLVGRILQKYRLKQTAWYRAVF